MRNRFPVNRVVGALVAALSIAGAGCGGSTEAGEFNNCTAAMFVDRTAASASRVINYGSAGGSPLFGYWPPCITIAAGQSVTFTGGSATSFSIHPLAPGVLNTPTAGSANNPIPRTSTGNDLPVTFPTAGTYPYICEAHAAAGMVGVVKVQ